MTPEICTHCGQPIGIKEELEKARRFENDESRRRQELHNALVKIATTRTVFDMKRIAETALIRDEEVFDEPKPRIA